MNPTTTDRKCPNWWIFGMNPTAQSAWICFIATGHVEDENSQRKNSQRNGPKGDSEDGSLQILQHCPSNSSIELGFLVQRCLASKGRLGEELTEHVKSNIMKQELLSLLFCIDEVIQRLKTVVEFDCDRWLVTKCMLLETVGERNTVFSGPTAVYPLSSSGSIWANFVQMWCFWRT